MPRVRRCAQSWRSVKDARRRDEPRAGHDGFAVWRREQSQPAAARRLLLPRARRPPPLRDDAAALRSRLRGVSGHTPGCYGRRSRRYRHAYFASVSNGRASVSAALTIAVSTSG